jgi:hypothetical protein
MSTELDYTPTLYQPQRFVGEKNRNHIYIPAELKREPLWLIAADENGYPDGKIPCVVTDSDKLQRYSKRMNHVPLSYSIAESMYDKFAYDFGICLTADNDSHYLVLDLDYKNLNEADSALRLSNFKKILYAFRDCYIEESKSGKGYHIIVKAELLIAKNFREQGIEVYSFKNRFILLTGNKVSVSLVSNDEGDDEIIITNDFESPPTQKSVSQVNKPIPYKDSLVSDLLSSLGYNPEVEISSELIEIKPTETDDDVFNSISTNEAFIDKFFELIALTDDTDWSQTRYPSASEAVLAFFNIVCRFTKSNAQATRLFKVYCNLSQRDKYTKKDYHINRCLTIVRNELDTSVTDAYTANVISMYYEKQKEAMEHRMKSELDVLNNLNTAEEFTEEDAFDMVEIEKQYHDENEAFNDIPYPEGVMGKIAEFSLKSAPHKLKVAHIASALAIVAGICGRQVRFRSSSTNLAIIVVAPSTMGKESCSKTLAAFSRALAPVGGDKFFCFDKIASGGALRTLMSSMEYGSVSAILTEFAQLIEQMKSGKDNAMAGLKQELLDAITKNSKDSIYGGSQHANSENNRENMTAPAFSMIGDTVPDFYEGITEEMCSGGFLSRFIIMEHDGHIKQKSDDNAHKVTIDKSTIDDLTNLIQHIKTLHQRGEFIEVEMECPLVIQEFKKYEEYLLAKFNKSKDEPHRQIYGRTLLKTMQVASLLAYTRNHCNPSISMSDFLWARNLIMRDVFRIERKLNNGEIGVSERSCRLKAESLIKRMITVKHERDKLAQSQWGDLLDLGIFPRSMLSQRLQGQSFKIGSMSNIKTLELIIDNMIKNGEIAVLNETAKEIVTKHLGKSVRGIYYQLMTKKYVDKLADIQASLTI